MKIPLNRFPDGEMGEFKGQLDENDKAFGYGIVQVLGSCQLYCGTFWDDTFEGIGKLDSYAHKFHRRA